MNRTKRAKAVLTSLMLAFVLTLGAGVVVGMAAGRHVAAVAVPAPPATRPSEHNGGWLPDALGLNSDQRDKLKAIWTETVQGPSLRANSTRRSQFLKERDDALFNLLTEKQKLEYKKAMTDYSAKLAELSKEREKVIQDAVERTKLILDDKQREKYDQILKDHGPFPAHGDHSQRGGPHGPHGPGHNSTRLGEPRTQPLKASPTTEEGWEQFHGSPATRPA